MTPLLDKASLRSRLRDTRGFMIAEQLASIVFIGLLCSIRLFPFKKSS